MNIKRFTAPDMRMAIHKVREAMGPDAVILSNKRVEEGVEIVAAVEYDESLIGRNSKDIEAGGQDVKRQEIWNDVRLSRNIPDAPIIPRRPQAPVQPFAEQGMKNMQEELSSLRNMLMYQLSGLAWGNEKRYHPTRARLLQRLIALGLSAKLARDLSEEINEEQDITHCWRMALGILAHRLPISEHDLIEKGGIVTVMGATGVGKTTTVAKLAARYMLKHDTKSVGLVSADNQRVASHAQLRSYARILGVPIRTVSNIEGVRDALSHFHHKELVIIDTAGMGAAEMSFNTQIAALREGHRPVRNYLVMATNSQRGVLTEVAKSFTGVKLSGCILSKVDETTSLGGALSVAIESNLPIAYLCDGQRVPDDLHRARAHSLVSRSVAIMQQVGSTTRDDAISLTVGGMVAHAHG